MKVILLNNIYKYVDEPNNTIRIIHISDDRERLYYVVLYKELCVPKVMEKEKLIDEISQDRIVKIIDPYLGIMDDNEISIAQREARDFAWSIVNSEWLERKNDLLIKKKRNKVFMELAAKYGITLLRVQRLFTRFWQRGMNKNAMIPDYINSGGRGKEKKLSSKKYGRPRNDDSKGMNVNEEIKHIFEIVIKKYYLKNNGKSIAEVYNCMLKDYFSTEIEIKGEKKFLVLDKSMIPSYHQFYYWIKKFVDKKTKLVMRESQKEFDLKNRELLSNSTLESNGPGVRFQIDSTSADIYLVSSLCRNRIIGRPTVYAIIDVFSREITGIYVGLESASWVGAMMALDNMVSNKVEFCAKYGIEISQEEWDCNYIPQAIIADRGEFEGYAPNNLICNLNIRVENTSPYRGDLKGIVERQFRTINDKIKHNIPGSIQKDFNKRGAEDYRLEATLTLEEFTAIIIRLVIHHNNSIISKYPVEKEMISDNIPPIPSRIWRWGIDTGRARLREVDRTIFRLNILPRGKAHISRAGIKFKNLYYSSDRFIKEQWFLNPDIKTVNVVYDPRDMKTIYILLGGNEYEEGYLLDKCMQYKDCILEEIEFNEKILKEIKEENKNNQNQRNVDLQFEIDKIVETAISEQKKNKSNKSKKEKISRIRDNRLIEKNINRNEETLYLAENKTNKKVMNSGDSEINDEMSDCNKTKEHNRVMDKLKRKRSESSGK